MRVIYPKNRPNQTYDYWLIKLNQQTLHIETNIFNSGLLQSSEQAIQNSGQLQNNTINGAMSITINRVIKCIIVSIFEISI